LVLTRQGSGLVQRAVALGVTIERSWADTTGIGALTSRVEWSRVEALADSLRASNENVAIARVELSDAEVQVQ
jgi:hypothetical protein